MGLGSIENALRCGCFCWHGHVQRIDPDTGPRKVGKTIPTGDNLRGHPRKTWLQCIEKDLKVWICCWFKIKRYGVGQSIPRVEVFMTMV